MTDKEMIDYILTHSTKEELIKLIENAYLEKDHYRLNVEGLIEAEHNIKYHDFMFEYGNVYELYNRCYSCERIEIPEYVIDSALFLLKKFNLLKEVLENE